MMKYEGYVSKLVYPLVNWQVSWCDRRAQLWHWGRNVVSSYAMGYLLTPTIRMLSLHADTRAYRGPQSTSQNDEQSDYQVIRSYITMIARIPASV
jgi:hypothetical protein